MKIMTRARWISLVLLISFLLGTVIIIQTRGQLMDQAIGKSLVRAIEANDAATAEQILRENQRFGRYTYPVLRTGLWSWFGADHLLPELDTQAAMRFANRRILPTFNSHGPGTANL